MEKNELKLMFITRKGVDYDDLNHYQLFFSLTPDDVTGDDWDYTPALGRPQIPEVDYIDAIYEFKTELIFDLAKESNVFSMDDCIDGVIALGWENIDDYETYPSPRIVFGYGDTLEQITNLIGADNINEVPIDKEDE